MTVRIVLLAVIAAIVNLGAFAQTADADSVMSVSVADADSAATNRDYRFKPTQLILPASLLAVGTAGVYWKSFKSMNADIRDGFNDMRGDHYLHADDYLQYLPAVAYLGLGFTGVKSRYNFKQRLCAVVTAYLSMTAMVGALKYTIRERRPDTGRRNSFPSGHTAKAFTAAELMRIEYGNWWGAGAYAVATGVAFLRLYNERHWFNDVIAGAGIGILSARIGYWMMPVYNRLFHWDSNSKTVVCAAPSYSPYDKSLSLNMTVLF